jgi:hypothetical protein
MKAVLCKNWGPPDSLVVEDVPSPSPGKGQLLVSVKASGVNFPDVLLIQNKYQFARAAFLAGERDRRRGQAGRRGRARFHARGPGDGAHPLGRLCGGSRGRRSARRAGSGRPRFHGRRLVRPGLRDGLPRAQGPRANQVGRDLARARRGGRGRPCRRGAGKAGA